MPKQALNRCLGLCIVVSAICIGCLPVPVPFTWYGKQSRTNVSEETALTIIPGHTTKEEVFLALGEPDEVSPDGNSFAYHWAKVKFLLLPAMSYTALPVGKKYKLLITFDEHGVVTQREVQESFTLAPDSPGEGVLPPLLPW